MDLQDLAMTKSVIKRCPKPKVAAFFILLAVALFELYAFFSSMTHSSQIFRHSSQIFR